MFASRGRSRVSVPQPSVTRRDPGTGQAVPAVDVTPGVPAAARRLAWGEPRRARARLGSGKPGRVDGVAYCGSGGRGIPVDEGQPVPDAAVDWMPPSWDDVVRDHSARVYRLAYRLTGDTHAAEDLTQEVFVRVFRSLPSYTPGTFEGWLHRITTNLFLDITRRRQRIRFEGLGEETAARLRGAEPTPSQAFDDRHLDYDVAAALADLPPEYRAAVVLCDIEGLTYEEIADVLGGKLGTVRSRIHRGRAQLRAALEHRRPRRAVVARRCPGEATLLGGVPASQVPGVAVAGKAGGQ